MLNDNGIEKDASMKKNFRAVVLIFLAVVLLICQNAVFIQLSQNNFCRDQFANGLLLRADIVFACPLIVNDDSSEKDFLKQPARPFVFSLPAAKLLPVRTGRASGVLQIADIRSIIEKSIPQYFNGSKYKSISLNA